MDIWIIARLTIDGGGGRQHWNAGLEGGHCRSRRMVDTQNVGDRVRGRPAGMVVVVVAGPQTGLAPGRRSGTVGGRLEAVRRMATVSRMI